jgi:hypothetical protein
LTACLITNHRSADAFEAAEVFSHCLFVGIFTGLMAGVVILAAASSRASEGIWDREIDGPIDGSFQATGDKR